MRDSPPAVLVSLLAVSPGTAESERAWAAFAEGYSTLLLHVARRLGGDHDAAMDRYVFMLDALRRDEYRRLRQYASDGRGKFTTWLMVVARRLCLDEYRRRYGRPQGADDVSSTDAWAERRRLINLVGEELGAAEVAGSADAVPDVALQRLELRTLVEAALARLDASDRLLLRLRFADDLSVPRIARLLGEGSAFHYYRRLEKILARLRDSLQAVGVENSVP